MLEPRALQGGGGERSPLPLAGCSWGRWGHGHRARFTPKSPPGPSPKVRLEMQQQQGSRKPFQNCPVRGLCLPHVDRLLGTYMSLRAQGCPLAKRNSQAGAEGPRGTAWDTPEAQR